MRRRRPLPSARCRSHTLCPAADAPRAAPDARSDQLDSYKAARAAQSKCAQKVDVGGFDKDDPFNVEEAVKGLQTVAGEAHERKPWQTKGNEFIGKLARRFFDGFGASDGTFFFVEAEV